MPNSIEEMPELTEGAGGQSSGIRLSFLSAKWINERIMNVAARVDDYIERLIDQGLLVDGFAPFESPITDELLARLTPDQFRALFDSEPSLEGKAMLIKRVKDLKLPIRELLPLPERAIELDAGLEREPTGTVSSSEASI